MREGRRRHEAHRPAPGLFSRSGHRRGTSSAPIARRHLGTGVARISDSIRRDTVFMPFHWEGANRLTNPALDPLSRMPEFKVCAVRVEKVA